MFDPNMDPRLNDPKVSEGVDSQADLQESPTSEERYSKGMPISDKMELEQEGSFDDKQPAKVKY